MSWNKSPAGHPSFSTHSLLRATQTIRRSANTEAGPLWAFEDNNDACDVPDVTKDTTAIDYTARLEALAKPRPVPLPSFRE